MQDFPATADRTGVVEPVPRRLRGYLGGACVLDTVSAAYVWDSPKHPAHLVPLAELDLALLIDEERPQQLRHGPARTFGLGLGAARRPGAVRACAQDADPAVAGLAHVRWDAMDAWFEEDEQVWVHPRTPCTRVDALRSRSAGTS